MALLFQPNRRYPCSPWKPRSRHRLKALSTAAPEGPGHRKTSQTPVVLHRSSRRFSVISPRVKDPTYRSRTWRRGRPSGSSCRCTCGTCIRSFPSFTGRLSQRLWRCGRTRRTWTFERSSLVSVSVRLHELVIPLTL
jgi:hypothetical protein